MLLVLVGVNGGWWVLMVLVDVAGCWWSLVVLVDVGCSCVLASAGVCWWCWPASEDAGGARLHSCHMRMCRCCGHVRSWYIFLVGTYACVATIPARAVAIYSVAAATHSFAAVMYAHAPVTLLMVLLGADGGWWLFMVLVGFGTMLVTAGHVSECWAQICVGGRWWVLMMLASVGGCLWGAHAQLLQTPAQLPHAPLLHTPAHL